jgi:hypothetical protein
VTAPDGVWDDDGNYLGCGHNVCEHRTVGAHRAWCLDCREWCYPSEFCVRGRLAVLEGGTLGS